MRIVIVGAGGVGGLLAGLLSQAGEEVAVVARGAHLAAIREHGLRVEGDMGSFTARVEATDSLDALAPADAVLVATKAWQVADVAPKLARLVREGTVVVPLQNGVEAALTLLGGLWPGPVLGGLCAVFSWIDAPGVIRMVGPPIWVKVGEWPKGRSARVEALCEVLRRAGVDARPQEDVEAAAWEKFLFIDPFGACGALAAAPIGAVRTTPETRALLEQLVHEVGTLARARGVHLSLEAEARTIAWFDRLAPDSTASMQRDLAAGRPSELVDQVGAVVRMAAESGVGAPAHRFALAALLPREQAAREKAGLGRK
ncbi:2-dehydropantoate 2-reductase [Anaeromyxobacter paludicola]|uniref:2-dehydropantoate 2-reductase n=1 Tax=Anaeromyxobacter paludicola TaxID=2918171 RepID=A0ABN6NCV1_9BACT|nr:2-dehydropantoate 2-reductase [Anaeromyxobacter paludicola]BDG09959.1 2-dehydropantoate 2-reductase [Anaeromyxobacter paludicola]